MAPTGTMTAEELSRLSLPNKRVELVRGVLFVREPAGLRHGAVAAELAFQLTLHVKRYDLGLVLAAESGFTLFRDPDTVRAPDIAFIRKERLPDPPPVGFAELAPDLVVEVVSPDDRPGELLAKIADWLEAGCRLVWVVDPGRRHVRIYRADGSETIAGESGSLDGEDVVPRFSSPVKSFL